MPGNKVVSAGWPNEFGPAVGSNSFDQRCVIVITHPKVATAGKRGDAIDLMVQGMTPLRNASQAGWPNEFGPTNASQVGRMNSALL